jgi:hypothetical protein
MVTIYLAFYSGIFGYRNIEETIDVYQAIGQILERVNLDLRNSFAYSNDDTKFVGNKNEISFLTLVDTFNKDEIIQDYASITYKLEGNKFMRLCRRNQQTLNEKSEIQAKEMVHNIEEINFNYGYRVSSDEPLKFDKESWDDKTKLPLAVKVKLTVKDKTKQEFERIIYLPLAEE